MRELANKIENMVKRDAPGEPGVWERLHIASGGVGRAPSKALQRELQELLKPLTEEDKEHLLQLANTRGWVKPRSPREVPPALESVTLSLRNDLAYGSGLRGRMQSFRAALLAESGMDQDTRDPVSLARAFLARVDGLARLHGDDGMNAHIEQARQDILSGVPDRYLERVLERVLDIEEARSEDPEALRDARDQRRKDGWSALRSAKARSESRGR